MFAYGYVSSYIYIYIFIAILIVRVTLSLECLASMPPLCSLRDVH